MKPIILALSLCLMIISQPAVLGQDCTPDADVIADDQFGFFPLPFVEEERPEGGIGDTAVLNQDFEFTFTVRVRDFENIDGLLLSVQSLSVATSGGVTYDPGLADFSYTCNPPNCVFPANQLGCLKIVGKTTDPAAIGRYDVRINALINSFLPLPISFPSNLNPGNYYLFVKNCLANLLLQETIPSDTYQASNQIIALGTIENGNSVVFKAGNHIQLASGFSVESGSDLSVLIEGCSTMATTAPD